MHSHRLLAPIDSNSQPFIKVQVGGILCSRASGLDLNSGFVDVHVHPPTKEFMLDAGGPYIERKKNTSRNLWR
jgi:hypothetical protein